VPILSNLDPMRLFGSSYPSVKLKDVAAKCTKAGIDATPPSEAPTFDYIIVGGVPSLELN